MKTSQILLPVIALVSAITVVGCSQSNTSNTSTTSNQVQQGVASLFTPVYASENYVEYSPEALAQAQRDGKKAAVFFHSKTCGSCAKLDGDFGENEVIIPEDTVIFKADWDENQGLAGKLNVAKYHTISYLNEDGTSDNVSGLFTVEEVIEASVSKETVLSANGQYKVYSSQGVAEAQSNGRDVALFFHSKTCGSCAKLDKAIVEDTNALPENMVVFKTDWDENQQLAKQYNVAKYHTIAFINDDKTSKNVSGLFTVSDLIAAGSVN